MCSRYLLSREALKALAEQLGARVAADWKTRFNIPPGGPVPIIRAAKPTPDPRESGGGTREASQREVVGAHWGLIPRWARTPGHAPSNARVETLAEKPIFREAFKWRRCILPASGFYEWERQGNARLPWMFTRADDEPLSLAGIWEEWTDASGITLESCAIVTTAANELMSPIHDRMPMILEGEAINLWLQPDPQSIDRLEPLLRPFPAEKVKRRPLDTRVNSVRFDDEACLAERASRPTVDTQLDLGFS